jgi:hypothetical protein
MILPCTLVTRQQSSGSGLKNNTVSCYNFWKRRNKLFRHKYSRVPPPRRVVYLRQTVYCSIYGEHSEQGYEMQESPADAQRSDLLAVSVTNTDEVFTFCYARISLAVSQDRYLNMRQDTQTTSNPLQWQLLNKRYNYNRNAVTWLPG